MMAPLPTRRRYDVVIAGARVAGSATALLLARAGVRVLVADPARRGSDTLSTHALMRVGVLQLRRWGLLPAVRDAGTPPIRTTVFEYGDERVEVAIAARDGVDALYAPRRTLLDELLVQAAIAAGAEVVHGAAIVEVETRPDGSVRGAGVASPGHGVVSAEADLLVGADGARSRVARLVGAPTVRRTPHAAATIYGYWRMERPPEAPDAYRWHYAPSASAGEIPTNGGETCVFASMPPSVFARGRRGGLERLYMSTLAVAAPRLHARLRSRGRIPRLRAFPGLAGFFRRAHGPGWALVGDAGYFRDPLTAHGITDALRDAELLARAVLSGAPDAFAAYQDTRDAVALDLLHVTDRLASFAWTLDEARSLHRDLSRAMRAEVELIRSFDPREVPVGV